MNEPVTVASNDCKTVCAGGSSGNVDQSNSSTANSRASNKNDSAQGIDQDQGSTQSQGAEQEGSGCCNGSSSGDLSQTQESKQKEKARNSVDQDANSDATSAPGVQSNVNAPVTVSDTGCCGGGSSGDVNQSNSSTANSYAKNRNESFQGIDQGQTSDQSQSAEGEGSGCCNPCQKCEPCPPPPCEPCPPPCDTKVLTRGALLA